MLLQHDKRAPPRRTPKYDSHGMPLSVALHTRCPQASRVKQRQLHCEYVGGSDSQLERVRSTVTRSFHTAHYPHSNRRQRNWSGRARLACRFPPSKNQRQYPKRQCNTQQPALLPMLPCRTQTRSSLAVCTENRLRKYVRFCTLFCQIQATPSEHETEAALQSRINPTANV